MCLKPIAPKTLHANYILVHDLEKRRANTDALNFWVDSKWSIFCKTYIDEDCSIYIER